MAESNGLIYALLFGGGSSGGGGTITPAQLAALMEGGTPIAVDVNEDGTKVNVHFDLTGASAGQVPMVNAAGTGVAWSTLNGNLFIATYGTTTATEVATAITANKAVLCYYEASSDDKHWLYLVDETSGKYVFSEASISTSNDTTALTGISAALNKTTNAWEVVTGGASLPTFPALLENGKFLHTNASTGALEWTDTLFATVTFVDTSTAITSAEFESLYSDYCYLMYDSKMYRKLWSGTVMTGVRGVIYYTINQHTGTGYPIIQYISIQDLTLRGSIFSFNMPTVAKDDDDDYAIQFDENGTLKTEKLGTVVSGINDGTNWTSIEIDGVLKSVAVKSATLSGTTLTLTI